MYITFFWLILQEFSYLFKVPDLQKFNKYVSLTTEIILHRSIWMLDYFLSFVQLRLGYLKFLNALIDLILELLLMILTQE